MFFTSTGYLIVMLLVGTPWLFAIPLAVFGAFFVEFIPWSAATSASRSP